MKNSKWTSSFWKIIWVFGLIIIAIISSNIVNHFKQMASETFNLLPLLWSNLFVSIIFGIYIALILVKKWSLNLDPTLFDGVYPFLVC